MAYTPSQINILKASAMSMLVWRPLPQDYLECSLLTVDLSCCQTARYACPRANARTTLYLDVQLQSLGSRTMYKAA